MKKLITLISFVLFLPACYFSANSTIDYHNLIVQQAKVTTPLIEETATIYNSSVPSIVTEEEVIETEEMQDAFDEAFDALGDTQDLLKLESRNEDQQEFVQAALETYISAAEIYLLSYEEMLTYYSGDEYKENISKVESVDESLHTNYTTFIEANNDLVETLEIYVYEDVSEEPENETEVE